jgi:hypothetical protein
MTKLQHALAAAAKGFHVFRVIANGKTPRQKGWQDEATRDPEQIKKLWSGKDADCNIGAFTSKFGEEKALIVVDVDNKNGKCGDDTLFSLDMGDCPFPSTFENKTPTGGRHVIYVADKPVKQGAQVLGDGLDIRSRGGYIVMAGSTIENKVYTHNGSAITQAPGWLYTRLLLATNSASNVKVDSARLDPEMSRMRCEKYMENAPSPEHGERNNVAYKLACELKDRGADLDMCMAFLIAWNEDLENPVDHMELDTTINSAYTSGQNKIGAKAPEATFEVIKKVDKKEQHPYDKMNEQFAFTIAGGGHHILWETTDEKGRFKLEHLNEPSFHKMLSYKSMELGDGKRQPLTKLWLADEKCRRYEGLAFAPGMDTGSRFYNMWRGFAYQPIRAGEIIEPRWQEGLNKFLEHALMNVCHGDEDLFHYLMSYFAHLIQKPGEKPLVALVFKGEKGVGKNALVERIAALIAPHYTVADDRRYLTGQFNGHLEACLMLVLDEAFWSGDKEAEGRLKGLITGSQHNIEHKGKEGFKVDNLTRCIVLGNEDWLVPATHDERRFAVFSVSGGRRKDRQFFESMRKDMESGGYRLLLTYLMEYDMKGIDLNDAPMTQGLIDQKHASLEPFAQWWLSCLMEGELLGSAARGIDFTVMNTDMFRNAFAEYARRRNIRTRLPDERQIGKELSRIARSMQKVRARVGGELMYNYTSNGLEELRGDWEKYVGGKVLWPVNFDEEELECLMQNTSPRKNWRIAGR